MGVENKESLHVVTLARRINWETLICVQVFYYDTLCKSLLYPNTQSDHMHMHIQKKIVRVINFSPYLAHTKAILLKLNILPFKDLVVHIIGIQMFKNNLGLLPNAVENLFNANDTVHSYNTRNRHSLRQLMVFIIMYIARFALLVLKSGITYLIT